MSEKELKGFPVRFSINLEISDMEKNRIASQRANHNYYKTEASFWGNKKDAIKLIFSLSIIFTALVSFIVLIFMSSIF